MADTNSTFRLHPYAPANETEADLAWERSNINGAVCGGIAYGVHITLFVLCFNALWNQRYQRPKWTAIFLTYICVVFFLGSIGNAANTRFAQLTFVDNREYPGGPNAYFVEQAGEWFNYTGYVVYLMNTWMQDGLLLYRYFIVWGNNWWMLIVPGGLYLSSIALACFVFAQLHAPGANVWQSLNVNFFLAFWAVSISTTVFITSMIVIRLLYMRARLRRITGSTNASPYLSISAMLIESAALYSAWALAFIISFAPNHWFQNIALPVVAQVESIAPLMIILRVAEGRGLTRATMQQATTGFTTNGPNTTGLGAKSSYAMGPLRFTTETTKTSTTFIRQESESVASIKRKPSGEEFVGA